MYNKILYLPSILFLYVNNSHKGRILCCKNSKVSVHISFKQLNLLKITSLKIIFLFL